MTGRPPFRDRRDAGRQLASGLPVGRDERVVVVGVARGGVVAAAEVAAALDAELDATVVRKLGYPTHPEAGFGAIGESGLAVPLELNTALATDSTLSELRSVIETEREAIAVRAGRYAAARARSRPSLERSTAIIVDDGIATGYTFVAALEDARARGATRLVAAAPVSSSSGAALVAQHCDESHILLVPDTEFFAVGSYYRDFGQVGDEEVIELLN